MGLVSQLVMRSFDVADKGEVNKGDGPLEKRGGRTPGHNHSKEEGKGEKKSRKVCVEAGSSTKTGQKGFFTIALPRP